MDGYLQNEFVIHYETELEDSQAATDMAKMRFQKQKTPILLQSHTEQLQSMKEKERNQQYDEITTKQSSKKDDKILYEQPEILKAGEKPGSHQDQNTEIVKRSARQESDNNKGWSVPEMKGSKQEGQSTGLTETGGLVETHDNQTPSNNVPSNNAPSNTTPSNTTPSSSNGGTEKYEAVDIVKAPSVVVAQPTVSYQTQLASYPVVATSPTQVVHSYVQASPAYSVVQQKLAPLVTGAPILSATPVVANLREPYQPKIITSTTLTQPVVTSSQLVQQELALTSQQDVIHVITPQEEQIQYNENQEKIERNHEQLHQTFDYISQLSTHLDSYQAISNFQNKLHHMQNALNIHNDEVADMISQNYQILEALYTQIIQVKEELVQIDVAQQKFQQIDDKLDEIETQKKGLENTKKILDLIKTVPKQQKSSYPSIITQYGSLYSQIYENHLPVVQNEAPEVVIEKMLNSNLIVQLSVPSQCEELKQFTDIIKTQSLEQDHLEKLFSDDKQKELLQDEKQEQAEEQVYQSRINIINKQIQSLVDGLQNQNIADQQQQVNIIHVLGEQQLNNDIEVIDSTLNQDEESSSSSSSSSDNEDNQQQLILIHPDELQNIDNSNFHVPQQQVTNDSEEESSSSEEELTAEQISAQDLNDVYNGKYDREVPENQHAILVESQNENQNESSDEQEEEEQATESEQEDSTEQEEEVSEQDQDVSEQEQDTNEQEQDFSEQEQDVSEQDVSEQDASEQDASEQDTSEQENDSEEASSTEIEEANEEAQDLLNKVKKLAESEQEEESTSSSSDSDNEDEVITLKLKKSKDGFDVVDNNNVTISSKQLKTVISSLNKGKKGKNSKKVKKN